MVFVLWFLTLSINSLIRAICVILLFKFVRFYERIEIAGYFVGVFVGQKKLEKKWMN